MADRDGHDQARSAVMGAANCWLIALAAVLGFVLTWAAMVARVKREESESDGAGEPDV